MTRAFAAAGFDVRPTDGSAPLVALYQAVAAGWVPPDSVSEAEYRAARALPDSDPVKGFAGWCASFGGKFFGGYARGESRNWAAEGKRALLRDCPGRTFRHVDFLTVAPRQISPAFIYADPPYAGTTGYKMAFDSARFWALVRAWSAFCPVFVSEYAAPDWAREIWSAPLTVRAGIGPGATAIEKLFLVGA